MALALLVAGADFIRPSGFSWISQKLQQVEPGNFLIFLKAVFGRYPKKIELLACTGAAPLSRTLYIIVSDGI